MTTERWPTVYHQLYGKRLTADDVASFEAHIVGTCGQPAPGEVSRAVRTAHNARAMNDHRAASAENIVQAIRQNRVLDRDSQSASPGHPQDVPHVELQTIAVNRDGFTSRETVRYVSQFADWSRRLKAAPPAGRWEIICAPVANSHCRERERYCERNGLEVEKPESFRPESAIVDAPQTDDVCAVDLA